MSLGQRRTDAPPSSVAQTMKKKGSHVEGNLSCAQVASQSSLSPRDHREIRITYISPLWNPPVTQALVANRSPLKGKFSYNSLPVLFESRVRS